MALPPRHAAVLLNSSAGALAESVLPTAAARVAEAFAAVGVAASVALVQGPRLADAVADAVRREVDAVVVGGGDGTLAAAAAVLAGGDTPLGVLPLGTLNHFARDAGIPQNLTEAVQTIAAGRIRTVDVGDANGRIFLNNSSIGLYPEMVREREQRRRNGTGGKWLAMAYAALAALRRFPLFSLTLHAAGEQTRLRTPFVFVGNNSYELSLFELGRRQALDGGELSLYVLRHDTRLALVRLALLGLLGRLDQDRDFRSAVVKEVEITTRRRRPLRVATDGEVVRLAPPIRYRVRPAALRVLAPSVP